MISYLSRDEIDILKYNTCLKNAVNSKVYAYSWYLDCVADNWGALILNDYEAVMPLPWRKKYTIKYVYTPFWLLELGIFFTNENFNYSDFLKEAFNKFNYIELRMNTHNFVANVDANLEEKEFQYLLFNEDFDAIRLKYRKDRLKDIKRAAKFNLKAIWNDNPEKLIRLFKKNVGKRTPNIKSSDYKVLGRLIHICLEKGLGDLLNVYEDDVLVAAGFFIKYQEKVTILISSTNFENRKNGANTFLIDSAISKYYNEYKEFSFGGSSIESIASYFESFGAINQKYNLLKYNNLPKILRLFKK